MMMNKGYYLKAKGILCPYCGAESVEGGFIRIDAGKAYQDMSCPDCDGRWQDIYKLVDVVFLNPEHGKERR